MLNKNEEKLVLVREKTVEVLEDLIISQKLALQALEICDTSSFKQVRVPLKGMPKKVDEIDNLILKIFALYNPEAGDLREMVAFLKVTSALQRIATNEKNYMRNMLLCNTDTEAELKRIIKESLSINRCTIRTFEYTIEMINMVDDNDQLLELESKIDVEYSKTDDIYSMIEKDVLQMMHNEYEVNDEYINLLKYIRKNLKIVDRLQDIASKIIFARIGGKL